MRPFASSLLAFACASVLATGVQAQEKVNLKMQATWPASLTLYENFTYFAERVNKMSGGSLKIETMPAGQVVPGGTSAISGARRPGTSKHAPLNDVRRLTTGRAWPRNSTTERPLASVAEVVGRVSMTSTTASSGKMNLLLPTLTRKPSMVTNSAATCSPISASTPPRA